MSYSDNDSENEHEYNEDIEEDILQLVKIGVEMAVDHHIKYYMKKLCRTSPHTGWMFVMELLNGHKDRCHQQLRMEKDVFIKLCKLLNESYGLKKGTEVTIEEAVAMFLITLGHGLCNRMVQERFQHSGETISRWFGIVLEVVSRMSIDFIKPKDPTFREIPSKIKDDGRYWPYFKDCIGAIDRTHIPVVVPRSNQIKYIERKDIPTQNVMAVCDFDMCFTFAWAGWEDTAHDARIFMEALRNDILHFPHPPRGKYYLVDAGYPYMQGYLGPYKGERYHLPDFRRSGQPRGKKEIFNHAHSSLRCTIERTFGV
ncbi:hypothetical protein K2173_003928 [Erythroxylum novogranatense]|uniref:DDE Tnp4 domain-containing protein n=1 Tax=Erythroxylum novogranatense TaxID=1862640 RepID=A0AAV8SJ98_9ROSI|nr:hypothetical protein K2173_003928 [Erythroxylum novogranatense]